MKKTPALFLLLLIGLTGCTNAPLIVRVLEYDAGGGLLRDATLGGCSVMTSENQVSGELILTYQGDQCQVEYSADSE